MSYSKVAKKFYNRERRLYFSNKKNIKSFITRSGLRRSLFMLDAYNQLNFKGVLYKKFIINLLKLQHLKRQRSFNVKKQLLLFKEKNIATKDRANDTHRLMCDDSTKLFFSSLICVLFSTDDKKLRESLEVATIFALRRLYLLDVAKEQIRVRILLVLRAYIFSMRKSRRHFNKAGTKVAKIKKAKSKARALRRVNKSRYASLLGIKYLRFSWTPADVINSDSDYWCRTWVFRRFINQPKMFVKSMYNINVFIREVFNSKSVEPLATKSITKSVGFIDYKIFFIYLDRNYANPFLFFDMLCDAVLTNNLPTYSIKTIGYSFITVSRFLKLVELKKKTKNRVFFKSDVTRALLNTEFTVL